MDLVANSTPMVDLDSKLNSFLVNRESRFDLPTPESPIRTTVARDIIKKRSNSEFVHFPFCIHDWTSLAYCDFVIGLDTKQLPCFEVDKT